MRKYCKLLTIKSLNMKFYNENLSREIVFCEKILLVSRYRNLFLIYKIVNNGMLRK